MATLALRPSSPTIDPEIIPVDLVARLERTPISPPAARTRAEAKPARPVPDLPPAPPVRPPPRPRRLGGDRAALIPDEPLPPAPPPRRFEPVLAPAPPPEVEDPPPAGSPSDSERRSGAAVASTARGFGGGAETVAFGGGEVRGATPGSMGTAAPIAPSPLRTTTPAYPRTARRRGVEGVVLVRAEVGADGLVRQVLVARSSGFSDLDRAAVEAVETWRFRPGRWGGQPRTSWVDVPVRFQLEQFGGVRP